MESFKINKNRTKFIKSNFFQFSFNPDSNEDIEPDRKKFEQLRNPAELHYLAYIYNWDDGVTVLEWILDSPLCTRSTANLLFWRAAPDYYLEFDINDENSCPSYNRAGFHVIQKVLEKYKNNSFSKSQIKFDPESVIEEIINDNKKWEIPSGVYDKISGVEILVEE